MQLSFKHQDRLICCNVIYRRRKTLAIKIPEEGKVLVYAPLGLAKETILSLVKKKADWILKNLIVLEETKPVLLSRPMESGLILPYQGEQYILEIVKNTEHKKPQIKILDKRLRIITPDRTENFLRYTLETWYREQAKKKITGRVIHYQDLLKHKPNRITIKEQKQRWGSCSSLGNLNFNWRIIMAPFAVLDYLVLHEMCHLVHLNHSKQFWQLVASIMPDYQEHRNWLKQHGRQLKW